MSIFELSNICIELWIVHKEIIRCRLLLNTFNCFNHSEYFKHSFTIVNKENRIKNVNVLNSGIINLKKKKKKMDCAQLRISAHGIKICNIFYYSKQNKNKSNTLLSIPEKSMAVMNIFLENLEIRFSKSTKIKTK